jgi:hypothetical protein
MARKLGFAFCISAMSLASCSSAAFSPPTRLVPGADTRSTAGDRVLHDFSGSPDGAYPYGGLTVGKHGELFGATNGGGTTGPSGLVDGTVYQISTSGKERVLYAFTGGSGGAGDQAGVVSDSTGNLYGATQAGGGSSACTNGCGTVYELQRTSSGYAERILHAFSGGPDGALPLTTLLLGEHGVLYGTTAFGGAGSCSSPSLPGGCGTVFSLTPSGSVYTEKILHSFKGGTDGEEPKAKLIADAKGDLYGTTEFGGKASAACGKSPSGSTTCGTIFRVTTTGKEAVLYRFNGGTSDGANPRAALLPLSNGTFVGLTVYGGYAKLGGGTAYELIPSGKKYAEKMIHFFGQTSMDGARPFDADGLAIDSKGNLYGTTVESTVPSCYCGTIFELSPSGSGYSESLLHVFGSAADGQQPYSSVIVDKGVVYGTTYLGGNQCYGTTYGCGTVYKFRP